MNVGSIVSDQHNSLFGYAALSLQPIGKSSRSLALKNNTHYFAVSSRVVNSISASLKGQNRLTMFRQAVRQFTTTSRRSNLIADLYVKELKAFKPTPLTAADAQAATKPWNLPKAAAVPALEAEGADALNAYSSAAVEVSSGAAEGVVAEEYKPDDWFVFPADEEPGHHH